MHSFLDVLKILSHQWKSFQEYLFVWLKEILHCDKYVRPDSVSVCCQPRKLNCLVWCNKHSFDENAVKCNTFLDFLTSIYSGLRLIFYSTKKQISKIALFKRTENTLIMKTHTFVINSYLNYLENFWKDGGSKIFNH